jgi:hypothetical protein
MKTETVTEMCERFKAEQLEFLRKHEEEFIKAYIKTYGKEPDYITKRKQEE